jgi:uncharacterized membrane protein
MPALTLVMVFITLLYPLVIWFGHGQIEPRFLGGLLVLIGLTRVHILKIGQAGRYWLGGTLLLFIFTVWSNLLLPLTLYPVLVNTALLGVFAYSLVSPPSMIERFARIR